VTQIELYEKRLDAVTQLIATLEEGTWAQQYWIGVYAGLLNTLNRIIHHKGNGDANNFYSYNLGSVRIH
jgi:hypothetical protein